MKKTLISLAAGVAAFGMAAAPVSADSDTIASIAAGNDDFTTLVAALDAAGLVGTFNDCSGPAYTVFAPTNAAFAAALASLGLTAEQLLGNTELLTSVLTYHVVAGTVLAADVVGLTSATTLNGAPISIAANGGVVLNGSINVVTTDITACNGVIHVIDGVLLPPAPAAELPPTGAENAVMVLVALGALTLGAGALLATRRRVTV